ncbi:MAG: hypothetical protein IPO21_02220 [Bacteroidales bacterium]|nr:hypothetical protein [Bacteroidales bacterium]
MKIILYILSIICSLNAFGEETYNLYYETPPQRHKSLLIEGDTIWCISEPNIGSVVMKLNRNTLCTVLGSSPLDTVDGFIDCWYKISVNNDTAWVFGSHTSIKSAQSKKTQLFITNATAFASAFYKNEIATLNTFIYPKDVIHCIQDGHGRCIIVDIVNFSENSLKDITLKYALNNNNYLQKVCPPLTYGDLEDRYEEMNLYESRQKELVLYGLLSGYNHISHVIEVIRDNIFMDQFTKKQAKELEEIKTKEKMVSYRLTISLLDYVTDFYFYFKNGKWYILGINTNDCSP